MTSTSSVQRNPSQIYRYHVENLREIEIALKNTARLARETITRRDPENSLRSWLRMYTLLIGAWAECRLQKLLHEEFGFTSDELQQVKSKKTQLARWQNTVDLAFCKHYRIEAERLNEQSLGRQNNDRYKALRDTLANDLKVVIEIRNTLAHGQWINPLNSKGTRLNEENFMSLQFKLSLVGHLADIVHDLVVSLPTFERDFDYHYRLLRQVRINLERRDYNKYKSNLENRAHARRVKQEG